MQDFAKSFYKSKTWQRCRLAYAKSKGGLCERCYAAGRISPGVIVHHKAYLTPETIQDPRISLNWGNLELLCRDCHGAEHSKDVKRWTIDDRGRVTARETSPV